MGKGKGRKPVVELEDLPEGWVIIEKKRETGQIDKYPYDTKTQRQFRSMVEVKRYLGLDGTSIPCPEPLQVIQGSSSSGPGPRAQNTDANIHDDQYCHWKDGTVPQPADNISTGATKNYVYHDFFAKESTNYQGSGLNTQNENKRKRDDEDVTPIEKTAFAPADEEEKFSFETSKEFYWWNRQQGP